MHLICKLGQKSVGLVTNPAHLKKTRFVNIISEISKLQCSLQCICHSHTEWRHGHYLNQSSDRPKYSVSASHCANRSDKTLFNQEYSFYPKCHLVVTSFVLIQMTRTCRQCRPSRWRCLRTTPTAAPPVIPAPRTTVRPAVLYTLYYTCTVNSCL